jgi:two-component sensor histidine kinase
VLAVADDGIGMMRDLEPSRSTTLGLQLVTTLVEQLDGRLDIERRGGTTFRITFPLDQDGAPPVMPLGPLGPLGPGLS